jgi:hypothetical protein
MAGAPNLADLASDLQACFSRGRRRLGGDELRSQMNGFLNVEGAAAFSAKGIGRPVLNQAAEIAADNLACFSACQGKNHGLCAECQSGASGVQIRTALVVTFGDVNHNCQVEN